MNLSFAGCGFLGIYHIGVAMCLKRFTPNLLQGNMAGSSAGALCACSLLCNAPLESVANDIINIAKETRLHKFGAFSPAFSIQEKLTESLNKHLPADAHHIANERLHISLTRVSDGKNVIVSHFNWRDDLLQALLCSCFIPGFSGILPPSFHNVRYIDGGFSNNIPILNAQTITVSPFSGIFDICPCDDDEQLLNFKLANAQLALSTQNIKRFVRSLLPPAPEVLLKLSHRGFDDALQYLHRHKLIT